MLEMTQGQHYMMVSNDKLVFVLLLLQIVAPNLFQGVASYVATAYPILLSKQIIRLQVPFLERMIQK